jgi:disulfide oxidoreductase YuzD
MRNFLRLKKMTNNKQQTAVEWLIEQLHRKYGGTDFFWTNMDEIEQAKEMEKERMIEFAKQFIDVVNIEDKDIEIIYNETYGEANQ